MNICYKTSIKKIKESIVYISKITPINLEEELFFILFYAEKFCVLESGRPIFGDKYVKTENGVVALNTRNIIRYTNFIESNLVDGSSFANNTCVYKSTRAINRDLFSRHDVSCLERALDMSTMLGEAGRQSDLMQDWTWINSKNGKIPYENFIPDEFEYKAETVQYMSETCRCLYF